MLVLLKGVKRIIIKLGGHWNDISMCVAQTSYYVLFSSIPFLMLVLMLLQAVFPKQTDVAVRIITDLAPELFSRLPEDFWDTFLLADIPIVSVTVAGMLWSASKGVKSLRNGLCLIYKTDYKENFARKYLLSFLYTLLLTFFSVVILAVTIGAHFLYSYMAKTHQWVPRIVDFLMQFRMIIMTVVVSLTVAMVYKLLAAREHRFIRLIPGALFSGMAWTGYSFLFSLYVRFFSKYSILYGSIGIVPVIMLWVYSSIAILLMGAKLNLRIMEKPPVCTVRGGKDKKKKG